MTTSISARSGSFARLALFSLLGCAASQLACDWLWPRIQLNERDAGPPASDARAADAAPGDARAADAAPGDARAADAASGDARAADAAGQDAPGESGCIARTGAYRGAWLVGHRPVGTASLCITATSVVRQTGFPAPGSQDAEEQAFPAYLELKPEGSSSWPATKSTLRASIIIEGVNPPPKVAGGAGLTANFSADSSGGTVGDPGFDHCYLGLSGGGLALGSVVCNVASCIGRCCYHSSIGDLKTSPCCWGDPCNPINATYGDSLCGQPCKSSLCPLQTDTNYSELAATSSPGAGLLSCSVLHSPGGEAYVMRYFGPFASSSWGPALVTIWAKATFREITIE